MKFAQLSAGLLALMLPFGAAQAATITASAGGEVIAAPAVVGEDNPTNDKIQAFVESTDVLLTSAIDVDGGTIAAGTRVDSHMVFLNSEGTTRIQTTATFTFSEMILGVMTEANGLQMFNTDALLGGAGRYTVSFADRFTAGYNNNRGFENDPQDFVTLVNPFTIDVGMLVTEPGDWMRVVTVSSIPLPAGVWLLMAGVGALGVAKRRRKAA